jgi:hypothetical protein
MTSAYSENLWVVQSPLKAVRKGFLCGIKRCGGNGSQFPHGRLTLFGEYEKTDAGPACEEAREEARVDEEVGQEAQAAYLAERLDHLGIVAGVCREIGLGESLDEHDTHSHKRVSVGTATVATLAVDEAAVARAVRRQASLLVATNVSDPTQLTDQKLIQTDSDQHSVERGLAFLKDPLFLASSDFVKKPERLVAVALVMVLCLLMYRLAEQRLREQLAAIGQTIPSQVKKPTDRPTTRWIFRCFKGVDVLRIRHGPGSAAALVLCVQPLHQQALALLGSSYEE